MDGKVPSQQDRLAFLAAASAGDIAALRGLVAGGMVATWPLPWTTDTHGKLPLHEAAFAGRTLAVEYLLDQGADIDQLDRPGWTPLHQAVKGHHKELVTLLLARGADPYRRGPNCVSALAAAVYKRGPNLVRLMLDAGVDPNDQVPVGGVHVSEPPLYAAAGTMPYGKAGEVLEALVLAGADPEARWPAGRSDAASARGQTPLVILCMQASERCRNQAEAASVARAVELLIEYGATANGVDRLGFSPMFHAVMFGNLALAQVLVSRGVAPQVTRLSPETGLAEPHRAEWPRRDQRQVQAWLDEMMAMREP